MLGIGKDSGPDPKCYFTQVHLPQTIDDKAPPTKRKPFSCLFNYHFNHTVDLLSPSSASTTLSTKTHKAVGDARYARVHLKLKDLIDGDFFNTYIKTGNVSLLSEGKPGVDNIYSLHEGVLRLELDKPTYERAGLAGKPIASPGRKHSKARYAVELNLRLPSMVRGRLLFNRIVYAFSHALTETKTWLFFDLRDPKLGLEPRQMKRATKSPKGHNEIDSAGEPQGENTNDENDADQKVQSAAAETTAQAPPIAKHHPLVLPIIPSATHLDLVRTPAFPSTLSEDDKIETTDLLEWLSLAMLDCPRLREGDRCDATLSRYDVPDFTSVRPPARATAVGLEEGAQDGDGDVGMDGDQGGGGGEGLAAGSTADLTRIRCHGFMPSAMMNKMLIAAIRTAVQEGTWVAMRVQSFGGGNCMFFIREGKAMAWEYT